MLGLLRGSSRVQTLQGCSRSLIRRKSCQHIHLKPSSEVTRTHGQQRDLAHSQLFDSLKTSNNYETRSGNLNWRRDYSSQSGSNGSESNSSSSSAYSWRSSTVFGGGSLVLGSVLAGAAIGLVNNDECKTEIEQQQKEQLVVVEPLSTEHSEHVDKHKQVTTETEKQEEEEEVEEGSFLSVLLSADTLLFALAAVATVGSAVAGIYCATEASKLLDILKTFSIEGKTLLEKIQELVAKSSKAITLGLLVFGLDFASNVLLSLSAESLAVKLRRQLFASIIRQNMLYLDTVSSSELINRLTADISEIKRVYKHAVSSGIRNSARVIGGLFTLYRISSRLTLIMFGLVISIYIVGNIYAASNRRLYKKIRDSAAKTSGIASEVIMNIRTVRAFANELREDERYAEQLDQDLVLSKRLSFALGLFQGLQGLVMKSLGLVVLVYGGNLVSAGELTMGDLGSFVLHSLQLNSSAEELSILYTELGKSTDSARRVFELIKRMPAATNGAKLESVLGRVEFKNVTFRYPSRPGVDVLHNFNLVIPAGSTIALVGKSGAGKSTILSLLERFYEPVNGAILLDGVPVSDLDPNWLRSQTAIVSQEPVLFATSILENIKYGKPQATMAEVEEAAKMANCHDFIESLPERYETVVGERGVALSGGQKQRIAIARAILLNPHILILDEATSALDVESEAKVQEAIDRLRQHKTVILISHRWNTVKDADNIVVLKHGKVVEQGVHCDLIKKQGLYSTMVHKQSAQ